MRSLGIILVVLGIIALVYTGFTYTTKEKVLDVGPIEVNKEKEHSVNWPPILGAIMLAGGVIIMVSNKKSA